MLNLTFHADDVVVSKEEDLYSGFFRIKQVTLKHKCFEGGWSEDIALEVFTRNPVAAVLPYDPVRDQIVLIEQFRAGCLGDAHPWLLELVAGIIEDGETPEQMAHRETQEEAGLVVERLHKMVEYWTSPGGSNEYLTLYCGIVDASTAGGIHGAPDEHEDIKVHVVAYDEAMVMLAAGHIRNAATIVALQWLQLNKGKVHQGGP